MAIQIGSYKFEGPYESAINLRRESGVYAILGKAANGWRVVDIGESQDVRTRVECHDRQQCWIGRGHPVLAAAAIYVPERQRMLIERELRARYAPPCGVC